MESFNLKPIAFFKTSEKYPQQLPRQASEADGNLGIIELKDLFPLKQALESIEDCPKLWLIFLFHKNKNWNPKVYPPRGSEKKIGVFSSRAPYRPNPIGLSCVDLIKVEGRKIHVKNHDLLDGTPILDIKPYLDESDSFPGVSPGWRNLEDAYEIEYSAISLKKISWLNEKMKMNLQSLLKDQLTYQPLYSKRKRIKEVGQRRYEYAYRTWRFDLEFNDNTIFVKDIYSGYSKKDLENLLDDPYGDKKDHQNFSQNFFRI